MKLLTSNLIPLLALGLGILLLSSVRFQFVKPNKYVLILSVGFLVLAVIGMLFVIRNPPGLIDTVEEQDPTGPIPEIPDSDLARLRLGWDSDAPARWPAAASLSKISEMVYEPPYSAERAFRELGFNQIMPVVAGSMIGYVLTGNDVTVVAFRGTDFSEISDWIANLDLSAIDTPHGQVHKGFHTAYQSMKSQVDAILSERDTTHLWVTGHSLGGAIALLCAYDLVETEQRKLDGVITFGQPMIARQQFAKHLDELLFGRYARFVNRNDLVPRIPPNHAPCGSLVWFTDIGVRRSRAGQILHGSQGPNQSPIDDDVDEVEITPMTELEFNSLQAELKAESAATERLPEGTPEAYGAAPAIIEDHYMRYYVDEVNSLLGITSTGNPD